jgi:hypothetical protein
MVFPAGAAGYQDAAVKTFIFIPCTGGYTEVSRSATGTTVVAGPHAGKSAAIVSISTNIITIMILRTLLPCVYV